MKRLLILTSIAMLAFLNLNARVTLGNVQLNSVSEFSVSDSVTEVGTTASITIPKKYALQEGVAILQQFKVGDRVTIEAGYNGEYNLEFSGYISEIDSDVPLTIQCEDMYFLRKNNFIKSYPAGTKLKTVLVDILEGTGITPICDDVLVGKYIIDNASTFEVLQDLASTLMMYSTLNLENKTLRVGLAYTYTEKTQRHTYVIGRNVKQNDLKFKRKEDVRLRVEVASKNKNGKVTTVAVGEKGRNVNVIQINLGTDYPEAELRKIAENHHNVRVFDGYKGSITGYGLPFTRAGDALTVIDRSEPDNEYREGTYLIESTTISFGNGGFSRQNNLSYKI
ncbi:MAG: hypothetical protein FWC39_07990 [Bacteroidetes bacterium]|nr:hypothetical protein [Bacteroidota bacterium]